MKSNEEKTNAGAQLSLFPNIPGSPAPKLNNTPPEIPQAPRPQDLPYRDPRQPELFNPEVLLQREWIRSFINLDFNHCIPVLRGIRERRPFNRLARNALETAEFWAKLLQAPEPGTETEWLNGCIEADKFFSATSTFQDLGEIGQAFRKTLLLYVSEAAELHSDKLFILSWMTRIGLWDKAIEKIESLPEEELNADMMSVWGEALVRKGDVEEAAFIYIKALLQYPDDLELEMIEHSELRQCYLDSLDDGFEEEDARNRAPALALIRRIISIDQSETLLKGHKSKNPDKKLNKSAFSLLRLVIDLKKSRRGGKSPNDLEFRRKLAKADKLLLKEMLHGRQD